MSNFVCNFVFAAELWWEPGEVNLEEWGKSLGVGEADEKICLLSIFMTHYHEFAKFSPTIDGYTDFENGGWNTCCMLVSRGEQKFMQNLLFYCYV